VVAGVEQTRLRAGDFIGHMRRQRGLSGRALGPKAGLSTGYVSRLEAGDIDPSLSCFARLVMALDMSPLEVWVVVRNEALATTLLTTPTYSEVS
jgi:predicted transcriptional regulator